MPGNRSETGQAKSGRFEKGVSGNPSGRPKTDARVKNALKAASLEAAETLIALMTDEASPPSVRLAAANSVLDRAYGKPTQALSLEGEQPLIRITLSDELKDYTK